MKDLEKWQKNARICVMALSFLATSGGLLAVVGSLVALAVDTEGENGWAAIGYVLIFALGLFVLGYAVIGWLSYLSKRLFLRYPCRIFPILGTVLDAVHMVAHLALLINAIRTLRESTALDPTAVACLILALLLFLFSLGVIATDIFSFVRSPEREEKA